MSIKPINIGVVGVGHLGIHHVKHYATIPNVCLLGIYDPDIHRSNYVAKKYRTVVFQSLEKLIQKTDALSIASTTVTSTAAELNILDGVTSTATELNIMDGDTSASSTTLVDADRVVTNDAGTMKQVALSDVKTYLTSAGFSSEDPTALAIALG